MASIQGVPEPVGEDYLVRRIKVLERRVDELGPSLMAATADAIAAAVVAAYQTFGVGSALVGFAPISYATMTVISSDMTAFADASFPSGTKNIAANGYVEWRASAAATGSGTAVFRLTREDGSYSDHGAVITSGEIPQFRLPFVVPSSTLAAFQTRTIGLSVQITGATFAADTYDSYGASTVFTYGISV